MCIFVTVRAGPVPAERARERVSVVEHGGRRRPRAPRARPDHALRRAARRAATEQGTTTPPSNAIHLEGNLNVKFIIYDNRHGPLYNNIPFAPILRS